MRKLMQMMVVLAVGAALASAVSAGAAERMSKKTPVAGFYHGTVIHYFDFGPIKLQAREQACPALGGHEWARQVSTTSSTPCPGGADYSPLWQVSMVTWKSTATPRLLRSKADVEAAQKAGEVTVAKTPTVVNCPVLGFAQKRITGFSSGHVIHYYDDGPVKVKPGNATAPLYAPMNGVAGQHNIALENVAPGPDQLSAAVDDHRGRVEGRRPQDAPALGCRRAAREGQGAPDDEADLARRELPGCRLGRVFGGDLSAGSSASAGEPASAGFFRRRRRFFGAGAARSPSAVSPSVGAVACVSGAVPSVGFFLRRLRRRVRDGPVFGCGRLSEIQPATSLIVPSRSRAASSSCVERGV